VNKDGNPDLVVANINSSDISVLLGNGNGTFQTPTNYAGARPFATIADVNLDGRPDLVGATGSVLSVLLQLGPPHHLAFTSSTAPLKSGETRLLSAEIQDENGNLISSDSSTVVTFTKVAGSGSLRGTGTFTATASNGIASVVVTGAVVGPVTIGARATGMHDGLTSFTVVK
jgi:hypothetical protein